MAECIVIASIASRKSIAVAKSIKDLLHLRVVGVAHTLHPHVFSRYFDKVHIVKAERDSIEWVYSIVGIARRYGCRAVLPIDFIDFYMFSKHRRIFEDLDIILISPSHESITLASDRVRCWNSLRDIVVFPNQVLVSSREETEKIYRLRPPLVVKNLGDASNPSFHLDYGTAVEDAVARASAVVQEYVEGIARGYYALAFSGVPILEFIHQRIVEYTPIGGASLAARGKVNDPGLVKVGRRILERLNWSGIMMVETKYSDEDGVHYVIELNPKFWGSIDLPESLGYRFSALLVALHLYGYDYALDLKKGLRIRDGIFVWLLDALRYIPKLPKTWLKLLRIALKDPVQSDVDLTDMPRNAVQLSKAFLKFSRERSLWRQYLAKSKKQLRAWLHRYQKFLLSPKRVVVLDFDATLVELPVNWQKLRKTLIGIGLIHPWESINRALVRYWRTDETMYYRLSEIIKKHEIKALDKVKPLIQQRLVNEMKSYAKICIATKQPAEVVDKALKLLKLGSTIDVIVGRDQGYGPIKSVLIRKCVELCQGEEAIVIDDNFKYIIDAYRLGYAPLLSTSDPYLMAKSYRLGIPASKTESLIDTLLKSLRHTKSLNYLK
mgnify:CR=1 FL=1